MCIGEAANDTLHGADRAVIANVAPRDFPAHDVAFECNTDGMTWAVLTPRGRHATLPRVTICRIEPCVMVLIEDAQARRQIRSLANVDDALDFGRAACDHALLAAAGAPSSALH